MTIDRNISEIRAEVLLNYLYPEMEERWVAHADGAFYRNYSADAMEVDEERGVVRLSRDGFLKLLPQGLLTGTDELKGEDASEKYKKLERRQHLLHEAFLPIDTFFFQKRLAMERQTSELLNEKLEYLLKTYFDYDLSEERNPLVREAAVLLPYVCRYRGDLGFVSNLLGTLMNCEVRMHKGRYSQSDTTVSWLPSIRYELLIPDLTSAAYRERCATLQPLVDFLNEWMIPFDVHCEVVIKEHDAYLSVGDRLTLNYNTELNQ